MKTFLSAIAIIAATALTGNASDRFICTGAGPCACWVSTAKKSLRPDGLVTVTCVNTRLATRKFYDFVDPASLKKTTGENDLGPQE